MSDQSTTSIAVTEDVKSEAVPLLTVTETVASTIAPAAVDVKAEATAYDAWWHVVYIVFFTSVWFVSDPGYTLEAKFGFRVSRSVWPNPLVPVAIVLWWQFCACCVLSLFVAAPMWREKSAELRESVLPGRGLVIMILLNAGAQAMQMAAVGWGSLSFSQVVRAMEPIFLLFWFKVSNTPVDMILYVSTLPIYFGAILSAGTENHFSWVALLAGTLSNFLLTGRNFFLKQALSDEKELPVSLLLFQTSFLPAVVCSFLMLSLVFTGIPVLEPLFSLNFMLSGVLFAVMRFASMLMLKEFSLLAHSLLKLSRRIVVIVIAYVIWHTQVDAIHVCGICMTLLGAAAAETVKRYQTWKMLIICFLLVFGFSGVSLLLTWIILSGKSGLFISLLNKTAT